jgi:ribosome-binding factor A
MTLRTEKVSSLLKKEVAELMLTLELPAMVTVSKAEVSPDLKYAKVLITILPSDEKTEKKVLEALHHATFEIQQTLNKKLSMKFVPRISFAVDYSQEYASHINKLIKETHEDDDEAAV